MTDESLLPCEIFERICTFCPDVTLKTLRLTCKALRIEADRHLRGWTCYFNHYKDVTDVLQHSLLPLSVTTFSGTFGDVNVVDLVKLLPCSLTHLKLQLHHQQQDYEQLFVALPRSLRRLKLKSTPSRPGKLQDLPQSLLQLQLPGYYANSIAQMPLHFPPLLTHLHFQKLETDDALLLPPTLQTLKLDNANNFKPDYSKLPQLRHLFLQFYNVTVTPDYFCNLPASVETVGFDGDQCFMDTQTLFLLGNRLVELLWNIDWPDVEDYGWVDLLTPKCKKLLLGNFCRSLSALPQDLTWLRLYDFPWDSFNPPQTLPNLQFLKLSCEYLGADFAAFVACKQHLQHLELLSVSEVEPTLWHSLPHSLQTLTVHECEQSVQLPRERELKQRYPNLQWANIENDFDSEDDDEESEDEVEKEDD